MQKVNRDNTESTVSNMYPPLVLRVQSIFIDLWASIILMYILTQILSSMQETPNWLRGVLFIGIWFVYEPVCMTMGQTLGNYIVGIKVRCFNDETKRINIIQAYIRFVVKLTFGWLSFLTIHTNSQKRALHDLASNSVMLYSDKKLKAFEAENI